MAFIDDKIFDTSYDLDFSGALPTDSVVSLLEDGSIYYSLHLYDTVWNESSGTVARLFLFDFDETYGATPLTGSWSFSGNDAPYDALGGEYNNGAWYEGVADGADYLYFVSDISDVGDTTGLIADYLFFNFKTYTPLSYFTDQVDPTFDWSLGAVVTGTGDDIGNWPTLTEGGTYVSSYAAPFVPAQAFAPDPLNPSGTYPGLTFTSVADGQVLDGYYLPGTAVDYSVAIDLAPVTIAITDFDTSLGTWQYRLGGAGSWLNVDTALVNSSANELALILSGSDELRMVPFGNLSGTLTEAITFRAADYDDMVSAGVIGSSNRYTYATGDSFSAAEEVASLVVSSPAASDNAPVFRVDYGEVLVNLHESAGGDRSADDGRDVVILDDGSILVAGGAYRYESSSYGYESYDGTPSEVDISSSGTVPNLTLTANTGALTGVTAYQWTKGGVPISGATSSTYVLDTAGADNDIGSIISVYVTHDSGVAFSENNVTVTEEKTYEGDYGLVKLNADGSLDTSFGSSDGSSDGILLYDGSTNDAAYALDLQADGQIWVAGYSGTDTDSDGFNDYNRFRLLEVNPAGSSVTSHDYTRFYDGLIDFSSSDAIQDVEVLLGSDWVVAGGASSWSEGSGDSDYAVRYYDQNGVLQSTSPSYFDTTYYRTLNSLGGPYDDPEYNPYYFDNVFNDGDFYSYPSGYTFQGLTSLTEDASGRILAAGTLSDSDSYGRPYTDLYLARMDSSGELDTSFSNGGAVGGTDDGWLSTEFTGDPLDVDTPLSVISLTDGSVLVVGRSDEHVGDSFFAGLNDGDEANYGLITTADSNSDDLNDRFEVDLVIDNNGDYGTDGNTTTNGLTPLDTGQEWRYQWQYSPNGSTWFDLGGVTTVDTYPASLGLTDDFVRVQIKRYVTATNTEIESYNSQRYAVDFVSDYDSKVSLLKVESDGDLDATFGGGDGKILLDAGVGGDEFIPQRAILDNDGNILVVGYSEGVETISLDIGGTTYYFDFPTNHMQVIRLTSAGALDTTFGDGGVSVLPVSESTDYAYGIAVQPDDRIVITGSALDGTDTDLAVVRLNADGTLDAGFGGSDAPGDGEVTFVEDGPAIVLYEGLGVYDTEHASLDDYDGATLVVERTATVNSSNVSTPAGANADDQFSGSGDLSLSAGAVIFDGVTVGSYDTGSLATGTLEITFNSNATSGDVNGVLSSIAYSNSNDNPDSLLSPPDSVVLTFTFNDNAATNSSNTSKSDTVDRTVNITPANDAPSPFTISLDWGVDPANSENSTVTASVTVTDPDGNGTLAYQWQSSDDGGTTWTPIGGASSSSFTPDDPQVGKILRVAVSYVDGGGTTESSNSAATGTILNVNDSPSGFSAGINGDTEGDTLSLVIGTPSDPDGLPALPAGYSYQWQVSADGSTGWTNIPGGTGSTLLAGDDEGGRYVRATVSYTDGGGFTESATTAAQLITNINDAPVNFQVTIDDTTPTEETLLTASASVDSDGDGLPALPAGYSYQWQSSPNGTTGWLNIVGATGSTFTPDDPEVGDYLRVITRYQDLGGEVEETISAATSAVVGINDTPTGQPSITGTQVVGYTLGVNTSGISDADGLSGTYSYEWYRESGAVDTLIGSGSTYTLTATDVGEQVYVRASYTDLQSDPPTNTGVEFVDSALSSVIAASNTTGGVTISNDGTPAQGETVTAVSTISDPDGLGPFSYQWYRSADGTYDGGDSAIAGATAQSYMLADADAGSYVFVVVSYTDGLGNSEVIPSTGIGPIADINAPGDVSINGSPVPLSTLGLTLSDPDGVGAVASYLWERSSDGSSWSTVGTDSSTLTLSAGDLGYQVRTTVTYTDGDGNTNQQVTSDPVLVVDGQEFGGIAYFWNVPHTYLEGVNVVATASDYGPVTDTTDASGAYGFGYMPDAEYSMTANKDGSSIANAVTAADATAILKMLVGSNPNADGSEVSPYQFIAADIDGDGHVSIADAIDALRMVVDAENAPADEWIFVEESRTFWNGSSFTLDIDDTDRGFGLTYNPAAGYEPNLVGVVKGDVDGSWGSQPSVSGLPGLPDTYFDGLSASLVVPLDLWGL